MPETNDLSNVKNVVETLIRIIPRKKKMKENSSLKIFHFILTFLGVFLFAGLFTGMGTAATIINFCVAYLSPILALSFSTQTIGVITAIIFFVYVIPWALIYMPDVADQVRSFIENQFSDIEISNSHDPVQVEIKQLAKGNYTFETAHKILAKVLRIINTHKQDIEQNPKVLGDTIEILLQTMIQIAVFDIYLIQNKNGISINEEKELSTELANNLKLHPFYSIITSLHNLHVRLVWGKQNGGDPWDNLVIEDKDKLNDLSYTEKLLIIFEKELKSTGKPSEIRGSNLSDVVWLNIQNSKVGEANSAGKDIKDINKLIKEQLKSRVEDRRDIKSATTKFRINKIKEYRQSQQSDTTQKNLDLLASLLGLANAIFGNGVGLSLAPLFILAPFCAIFGAPNLVLPSFLALSLVSVFAIAGFVAAYGLTRTSIRAATKDMVTSWLESDVFSMKSEIEEGYDKYHHIDSTFWLLKFFERNTSIAYVLAVIMALAVASFNFQAGVMFAQLFINPSILLQPSLAAGFGIASLTSLTSLELIFGWLGFSLTFVAVTPLMATAVKTMCKSLRTEPFLNSISAWFFLISASSINTILWTWMMLKAGSPLHLLLPKMVITVLPWVGIPSIFILSTALLYVSIKNAFDFQGRDIFDKFQEFSTDPNPTSSYFLRFIPLNVENAQDSQDKLNIDDESKDSTKVTEHGMT